MTDEQQCLGVTFKPDPEGWTVGYLHEMDGGERATGYDLGNIAHTVLRPLVNLAEQPKAARPRHDVELVDHTSLYAGD